MDISERIKKNLIVNALIIVATCLRRCLYGSVKQMKVVGVEGSNALTRLAGCSSPIEQLTHTFPHTRTHTPSVDIRFFI